MKSFLTSMFAIAVVLAQSAPPEKLRPGCNAELLKGEFALEKAPEFPCSPEHKQYIVRVIDEVKGGYAGTVVTEDVPHHFLDTPEFIAFYTRSFSGPGETLADLDFRYERLLARVSQTPNVLEDSRLDWDFWRAWLLFEDMALDSTEYQSGTFGGSPVMSHLECARDLVWAYLDRNAAVIVKDERRRQWWISQLTRNLEAPGGRPARCWFLLQLVAAADPHRTELQNAPIPEKFAPAFGGRGEVRVRQPHPLDPFLLRSDLPGPLPPFAESLWRIAAPLGLKLTVLGVDPATMPATHTEEIISRQQKWAMPDLPVINQESWSKEPTHGYTWGVSFFRPVGRRDAFASISFPGPRSDGVYFFVFQKRLHVWPKSKMDAAALTLLKSAGLADAAMEADWKQRGLVPLEVTLTREE